MGLSVWRPLGGRDVHCGPPDHGVRARPLRKARWLDILELHGVQGYGAGIFQGLGAVFYFPPATEPPGRQIAPEKACLSDCQLMCAGSPYSQPLAFQELDCFKSTSRLQKAEVLPIVGILLSLLAKTSRSCPTELVGSALTFQQTPEVNMYQRTVLVVDDEPLIRMGLADCLADEGYAVLEAANVLEAVAVLGRHQIEALITDVDMPGALNGFDLARLVVSYEAGVAVIVTSGGHTAAEIDEDRICFLAKPYKTEIILDELEKRISSSTLTATALAS